MRLTPFFCAVALLGTGCSAAGKDMAFLDSGMEADAGSSGGGQDTEEYAEPTWWRLDSELLVSAGQLSRTESQLIVSVLDFEGLVLCTEEVRVAETDTIPVRPESELLTWWSITLGDGTRTCAGIFDVATLPDSIEVGVGQMHPELKAVSSLVSDLPDTGVDTLNGAYARLDSDADDIWVYGYAGDAAAWLGTAGPATVAPLADGRWTLRGVYSFPIADEAGAVR